MDAACCTNMLPYLNVVPLAGVSYVAENWDFVEEKPTESANKVTLRSISKAAPSSTRICLSGYNIALALLSVELSYTLTKELNLIAIHHDNLTTLHTSRSGFVN